MPTTIEEFDLPAMQAATAQACGLMKVLANPDRMMLLCQLAQAERCVSELEGALGIAQPTLSQQLAVLREEKLVSTRREGKQIFYRIASAEAMAILQLLHALFCANGEGSAHDRLA